MYFLSTNHYSYVKEIFFPRGGVMAGGGGGSTDTGEIQIITLTSLRTIIHRHLSKMTHVEILTVS